MSFDTIIKNGTVVDGSGLPKRVADVGIRDGIITDIGRLSRRQAHDRRRRAGRHARHRRRPHALRSAAHLRAVRHLVVLPRRHLGGRAATAATRSRRAAGGPRLGDEAVRQGRGHVAARPRARVCRGTGTASRRCSTRSTSASASTPPSTSATRRCAASSWARPRRSARRPPTSSRRMQSLVREAMRAGAAGFTSSHAPTHVDPVQPAGAVAPRRLRGGAGARGRGGRGRRRLDRLPARARPCRATTPRIAPASSSWRTPPGCRSSCRAWAIAPASARCGTTRPRSSPTRASRARRSSRCCARSRSCARSTGSAARRCSTASSTGATSAR